MLLKTATMWRLHTVAKRLIRMNLKVMKEEIYARGPLEDRK